jgi:hypothetical protein
MQEFVGADYRLIRNSPVQRRRAILQNRLAIESMRARSAAMRPLNACTAKLPHGEPSKSGEKL